MDPQVVSALIAAAVSASIAAGSGFYTLYKSERKLKELRSELVEKTRTERLLTRVEAYRREYRVFESAAARISREHPGDGTALVRHFVDFYAGSAKPFFQDARHQLEQKELDHLHGTIERLVESGRLDGPPNEARNDAIHELFESMKEFFKLLFDSTDRYA